MAKDSLKGGSFLKASGGVGKGFFVADASTKLKGPSVNSGADRGSKVAKNQGSKGPRTA